MRRRNKTVKLVRYQIIGIALLLLLWCEHKKFLNPSDPENLPPAPVLLFPVDDTTSNQNPPYFQWEIEEDTLNPLCGEQLVFELQIDNNQDFSSVEFVDSNIDYESYMPSFHCGEGNYYWHARTQYLNGSWGTWSETRKFDVRFPVVGACDISASYADIVVSQNFAFLAYYNVLKIIDISNPCAPQLLATIADSITNFDYIFVSGNYLYATHHSDGCFSIYDITNPANIVFLKRLELPPGYGPVDLWVENEKAYICSYYNYDILVFDVSDPDSVFIADSLPTFGEQIIAEGNYAYILKGGGMDIVNLADNTIISSIFLDGGNLQSFWIQSGYAFIAGDEIWIYDISNPYSPSLRSNVNTPGFSITAANNYLFFNCSKYDMYNYVLAIYDISNPSNLTELGNVYNTANHGEIFADDDFVYTTDFLIIKYE